MIHRKLYFSYRKSWRLYYSTYVLSNDNFSKGKWVYLWVKMHSFNKRDVNTSVIFFFKLLFCVSKRVSFAKPLNDLHGIIRFRGIRFRKRCSDECPENAWGRNPKVVSGQKMLNETKNIVLFKIRVSKKWINISILLLRPRGVTIAIFDTKISIDIFYSFYHIEDTIRVYVFHVK